MDRWIRLLIFVAAFLLMVGDVAAQTLPQSGSFSMNQAVLSGLSRSVPKGFNLLGPEAPTVGLLCVNPVVGLRNQTITLRESLSGTIKVATGPPTGSISTCYPPFPTPPPSYISSCPPQQWFVWMYGSDTLNDGSAKHPFKTIQHAINLVQSCGNASVFIKPGRYYESITINTAAPNPVCDALNSWGGQPVYVWSVNVPAPGWNIAPNICHAGVCQ